MQNKSTVFIFTVIIFLQLLSQEILSQSVSIPDSIIVFNKHDNNLLFKYKVNKGNTVYSISKFFKVDIMQIYGYNPQLQSRPLDVGAKIFLPFNVDLLSPVKNAKNKTGIKVFYKVGAKDNLFRIAKIYFKKPVSYIVKINNLQNNIISPGQLIYVGNVSSINEDLVIEEVKKTISFDENKQDTKKIVKDKTKQTESKKEKPVFVKKIKVEETGDVQVVRDSVEQGDFVKKEVLHDSGLAIWNKDLNVKGIFVLNNEAKLYTLMELFNPLVNKKIVAKVIGRIPDNTYPDYVKIILSPDAAKSLRAIDSRIFIRYKYLK